MRDVRLIELENGGKISIDNVNCGEIIEGPATLVVLKKETTAGTVARARRDQAYWDDIGCEIGVSPDGL